MVQYSAMACSFTLSYPQAHEDDAQRACAGRSGYGRSCAQELNTHLAQRHGVRVAVRIGIHTGVVVVGEVGVGARGTVSAG